MLVKTSITNFKFLYVSTFLTFAITANAAEITWIAEDNLGADWNDPVNWDLGRVPLVTDSVFTFYGDLITISTGYTAKCNYFKLIGNLNIVAGGKLVIKDGQFDALGDVANYGSIRITNSPEEGMIFSTGASDVFFDNHGEIYIDQSAEEGFVIRNDQVFRNHSGGYIEIINANLESFKVIGTFVNSGTIRCGTSGIGIALSIDNVGASIETSIENQLCGKIQVLEQIEIIDGTLNNYGFLRQNYDGENSFSSIDALFNNYGIVEDIKESFNSFDFDVQTIWLKPVVDFIQVNTGEPIAPFVDSFPVNTLYSDIFADNLLTQNAGTYDAVTNTWIPNANANGLSTFFIEISQLGGCADTLRFDLENPVLATTYWLGGNGNWQLGAKWSTGSVPTINDLVGIYYQTDEVFIPISTQAFAKQVFLAGKLTLQITTTLKIDGDGGFKGLEVEKGTLINNGNLLINDSSVGIDALNATLTNNNNVTCNNTSTCIGIDQNAGLIASFTNNGTVSNTSGDLIDGDDAEMINTGFFIGKFPIVEGVASDNLRNEGTIDIEGDGNSGRGVDGEITNTASGIILVEKLNVGVEIKGSNLGTINTHSCITGIEIKGNFENFAGGEMEARNSTIGVRFQNGTFENRPGASLKSIRNGLYGLLIDDPQQFISYAHLVNEGEVEIDSTTGVGVYCMGDLSNQGSGMMNIRNSESQGLHMMAPSANLLNHEEAKISILKSGGIGLLQEGGFIDNNDSAIILIDRSTLADLEIKNYVNLPFNYPSSFENRAFIRMK